MTDVKPLRFFSYSRDSKDERCERSLYLGSEWGGTGLEAVDTGWDAMYGNIIHKYLNCLALDGKIDYLAARKETLELAQKAGLDAILARDYAVLAEGQLRAFVKAIWPRWMAEYDILETEKLRAWEVEPGYIFRFRQDILLKSKIDGHIAYPDYKTTSSNSPQWIASWAKSIQLHSSMYAMKNGYGLDIQHAFVPGFYKGYKDKKDNTLRSVFTCGYVNREYSMSPQYSYETKRARGWERFSTYEEFEDLSGWVANMPDVILIEQFPTTGPIFLRLDVAERYFRQRMIRQREIADAIYQLDTAESMDTIYRVLDTYFRQDFSNCQPAYGFSCEFLNLCWQKWVEDDPLGSGLYVRKTPAETEEIQ